MGRHPFDPTNELIYYYLVKDLLKLGALVCDEALVEQYIRAIEGEESKNMDQPNPSGTALDPDGMADDEIGSRSDNDPGYQGISIDFLSGDSDQMTSKVGSHTPGSRTMKRRKLN